MIMKSRNSLFFLLMLLPVIAIAFVATRSVIPAFSGSSGYTVVLDAGHGAPG